MRISEHERVSILKAVHQFDSMANVFLFGSRINPQLQGGDIDLLIESNVIASRNKRQVRLEIQRLIGEQKIDIVITKNRMTDEDPFIQLIAKDVVRL